MQHRNVNFSITAFLHLHAALSQKRGLIDSCKIVFACSLHGSPEMHNIKQIFGSIYDIDIFECEASYLEKIHAIFSMYSTDNYSYFIKHDEDIFISQKSWISFLENSLLELEQPDNLLTTVNLSTGLPSWHSFSDTFFSLEERDYIRDVLVHTKLPNELWGNDYSLLNIYISSLNSEWNEEGYWKKMNSLGHHYRGLHPVRVNLKLAIYINQKILERYDDFQELQPDTLFKKQKKQYLCNSFFCINYIKYHEIIANKKLFIDRFDEVPINRYALDNNLNFCYLNKSMGIHIIYNSVYDEAAYVNGKKYSGMECEILFLGDYLKKIENYLINNSDKYISGVKRYKSTHYEKIRLFLKRSPYLVKVIRALKDTKKLLKCN